MDVLVNMWLAGKAVEHNNKRAYVWFNAAALPLKSHI